MTGAVVSGCGTYRYELTRFDNMADPKLPVIAFFGVNPSTADAHVDDHTTTKLKTFTRLYPARGYLLGNAFGFRAKDVKALRAAFDPIGPENDHCLADIIAFADVLVPMWGARGKLPKELRPQLDNLRDRLFDSGKPVLTFGLTQSGDPKHPLMLKYSLALTPWLR